MANILLLDDSDVAGRAMQGILARGNHVCVVAKKTEDAWRILREGVVFDLVFLELKVGGSASTAFLQRLRDDWFWKALPVVVYTYENDVKLVRRALELGVRNYLIKPYGDELVFAEVAKVEKKTWRDSFFEEPKAFCASRGLTAERLASMRRGVMTGLDRAVRTFPGWAEKRQPEEVKSQIAALLSDAEAAGVWVGANFLRELQAQAASDNWAAFFGCAEILEFASRLVYCQLNPGYAPASMHPAEETAKAMEAAERERWERVDVNLSGPLVDLTKLFQQVEALRGCPVIDTSAAAFQMAADTRASGISQALDLVADDPGLCAQVLIAARQIQRDEMDVIDDVRAAASLLGELKLGSIATSLTIAEERHLHPGPLSWAGWWTFQVAVGRVAEFICTYLEFDYLGGTARTAGLLHDIGKLILLKLYPFALSVIVREARERKLPLSSVERQYLGCTTRELATRFADARGLPPVYADVIRWVETPAAATAHGDLIAMVALARHVCLHAHVGNSGDAPGGMASIGSTPAWQVLQQRLFPSFDLRKFEVQSHAFCLNLRSELSGQRGDRRPSHAQRAAELV